MQEHKMPHEPLSLINAKVKAEITMAIRKTMNEYPLPLFMVEGILNGILLDIRAESASELASETDQYNASLRKYYEDYQAEMIKSFEEQQNLVEENPEPDPGESEEVE